jgi:hypothetical protein
MRKLLKAKNNMRLKIRKSPQIPFFPATEEEGFRDTSYTPTYLPDALFLTFLDNNVKREE